MTPGTPTPAMSRKRRTRVLVEGDPALARELCARVESLATVERLDGPREVLLMNKVRESAHNSLFYLGEALLTECKVRVGGTVGIGLILGRDRDRAYELAVIDATFAAPAFASEHALWCSLVVQEEQRLLARERAQQTELAATRVEFADMLTEDDK